MQLLDIAYSPSRPAPLDLATVLRGIARPGEAGPQARGYECHPTSLGDRN